MIFGLKFRPQAKITKKASDKVPAKADDFRAEIPAAGEVFGSIEAVKTVSDAFLPVGGEIVEFNEAVDADPAVVNRDAYGEGWLVKVKMSNPAEYDALLGAADYEKLIG